MGWQHGAPRTGQRGHFPVPPAATLQDIATPWCSPLEGQGVNAKCIHHEVAAAAKRNRTRFNSLVKRADWDANPQVHGLGNVAHSYGKTAIHAQPIVGDQRAGCTFISQYGGRQESFHWNGYSGLSDSRSTYIGGIIKTRQALNAITIPVQLLQAFGAGIRGADQSGLFLSQSARRAGFRSDRSQGAPRGSALSRSTTTRIWRSPLC